jgi:hypothetical protein
VIILSSARDFTASKQEAMMAAKLKDPTGRKKGAAKPARAKSTAKTRKPRAAKK